MVEIKDYLKYYVGSECNMINCIDKKGIISGTDDDRGILQREDGDKLWYTSNAFKPKLKSLSDISEQESRECFIMENGKAFEHNYHSEWIVNKRRFLPETFKFLLDRGFDIFGLIDKKLAIKK